MFRVLVVGFLAGVPLFAAESCPVLNAATAAGIVGGAVDATYTASGKANGDGVCEFARPKSAYKAELRIDVETMTDPGAQFRHFLTICETAKAPVSAIGNEAVSCFQQSNGQKVEQIIGRVRDRAFVIKLSSNDPSHSAESLREKALVAAEQVSGILF